MHSKVGILGYVNIFVFSILMLSRCKAWFRNKKFHLWYTTE